MPSITAAWLRDHGVVGSTKELAELAALTEDTLELRVGSAIAEQLSEAQIGEFGELMAEGSTNENARVAWLTENYPEYEVIAEREIAGLKRSIEQSDDPVAYIRELGV